MKTFTSDNARWPGTISTDDFMKWPELSLWEDALKEAQKLGEDASVVKFYSVMLPVTLEIIKEWHIEGLPEKIESADALPASTDLMKFMVDSISTLFQETNSLDPNLPGRSIEA